MNIDLLCEYCQVIVKRLLFMNGIMTVFKYDLCQFLVGPSVVLWMSAGSLLSFLSVMLALIKCLALRWPISAPYEIGLASNSKS